MDTAEFVNKFYTECQCKREVINPYTGDIILVPCGVCDACRVSKSILAENRIYAQKSVSKYCYFVSLTYKNEFIPYYEVETQEIDEDNIAVHAFARPRRRLTRTITFHGVKHVRPVLGLAMDQSFEFDFSCKKEYWNRYSLQADLSFKGKYPQYAGRYGFLCHKDLSLFMKRVRKQILLRDLKPENEKLHTYIVGEYGPVSFRPHFHILFFFDSDKLAKNFIRVVNSCWKFGRVDCSASRGQAESYVAGYLNSFTSLPLHFKENRCIRPFARFSNHFGFQFFSSSIEEGRKGDFSKLLDGVSVPINGKYRVIRPWSSIIDTCFFRPVAHGRRTVSEYVEILRYARNICQRPAYWKSSIFQIPRLIYQHYYSSDRQTQTVKELSEDFVMTDTMQFLHIDPTRGALGDEFFERSFCSRFYIFFRHCELFLSSMGFSLFSPRVDYNRIYSAIKLSKKFFDVREKQSLHDLFSNSQSFESDWSDIFWNQTEERQKEFAESGLGSVCRTKLSALVHSKVKHRHLNDMNNFFTERANYNV